MTQKKRTTSMHNRPCSLLIATSAIVILSASIFSGIAIIQAANADSQIANILVSGRPAAGPGANTFDPLNGNIYAANADGNFIGYISVIHGSKVIANITGGGNPGPQFNSVTFDPNNGKIYAVDSHGSVFVVDPSTNQIVTIISGHTNTGCLSSITSDPTNKMLYVANACAGIAVINGTTNTYSGTIDTGQALFGIAFNANNGMIYATVVGGGVAVINPSTGTLVTTITDPNISDPFGIAYDPNNGHIFVVSLGGCFGCFVGVNVIDSTNTVVAAIPMNGVHPQDVAIDPFDHKAYVTSFSFDTQRNIDLSQVISIDDSTNKLVDSIGLSEGPSHSTAPYGVSYNQADHEIYVGVQGYFENGYNHHGQVAVISTSVTPPLHTTSLTLNTIRGVPWGNTVTVTGKLTDINLALGIGGASITFTGTGAANLASTTTASDGTFSISGTAPNTVATGWTVQTHFAGGGIYKASNSATHTYNTFKHATSLTLTVSPTSVTSGGTYMVSGTLKDTTANTALSGMTISFTADFPPPSSATTNSTGGYSVTGLTAPTTPATYHITAHFATTSLYNAANSPVKTLKVTPAGVTTPATTPTTSSPANTAITTTPPRSSSPSTGTLSPHPYQNPPTLQQQQLPPIAKAGVSQTVNENTRVTLDGRASYSPNIGSLIVAYQWTQLPATGGAVPVNLIGANTATPTFTASKVSSDTVLAFSLRVMDNHGATSTNPAVVYIIVKHNPNVPNTSINTANSGISKQQQQPTLSTTPHIIFNTPSIFTPQKH